MRSFVWPAVASGVLLGTSFIPFPPWAVFFCFVPLWRVWLDGRPVTDPIVLPGSHHRWEPLATAESWNGGVATCNGFGFRFERVGLARSLGGSWQTFAPGYTFRDRGYTLRQLSPAPQRHRTLSAGAPQAYAFDAQST